MTLDNSETVVLKGGDLRCMILEACAYFDLHKESINDLNVFPVPDGDTGTNMGLTMLAAARELEKNDSDSIGEVAGIMAQCALMGARGNSGVILSQLFRGIARGLSGKNEAQLTEMGKAFQYGIVYAYNAVSKPVEGTILTVAREIARGSRQAVQTSLTFIDLLRIAVDSGRKALEQTPELLPILKEAGVVDAGGLGLVVFLEGCLQSLLRHTVREQETGYRGPEYGAPVLDISGITTGKMTTGQVPLEDFNHDFPYCTELLLKGGNMSAQKIRKALEQWGDSLLVAGEPELMKVHIHTAHPGNVLEACLFHGSIHDIKIENMLDQYKETQWSRFSPVTGIEANGNLQKKTIYAARLPVTGSTGNPQIGVVTVLSGEGLSAVFTSLGADKVVSGGQSMNPSVKEIVDAVAGVEAEKIIVLPNNRNIKLSAQQASGLIEKEIMVVDTRSIPEGLAALLALDRGKSLEDNFKEMNKRARLVKTGEVTFATRNAVVNNIPVKKGQIIGICDGCLMAGGELVNNTALELIRLLITGDEEIITLFYGQDISAEQAGELADNISEEFPEVEVEIQYGGQPLYYYLFSVE